MPLPNLEALAKSPQQFHIDGIDEYIESLSTAKHLPEYKDYKFYDDQVTIRYDIPNHIYYLVHEDGTLEELVSSSQVGQVIDKSQALVPWACKMMAEKLLATVPRWDFLSDDNEYEARVAEMPLVAFAQIVTKAKTAHKDQLDDAGTVGTQAHDWIEGWIKNDIAGRGFFMDLPEDDRVRKAIYAALEWMRNHNVRWRFTERKVYSRRYKYAGTFDGLAMVDSCGDPDCCPKWFANRLAVIDWKTSNHLHIEYILQITSYMQAYIEETGEPVTDRFVIRLGKNNGEFDPWHLTEDTYEYDLDAFLTAYDLTMCVGALEKRMAAYKSKRAAKRRASKAMAKADAARIDCGNKVYKGIRKPKCTANEGNPCQTCQDKYNDNHLKENVK